MAQGTDKVRFDTSVAEPEGGRPARIFVWVRRFQGEEELTGRYEVFGDLASFDEFIARHEAAGEDVSSLRTARDTFAGTLQKET
jgi:hypothetical protein